MQTHSETEPKRQEPFTIEIKLPGDIGCSDQPKSIKHCVRIGQEAWTRLTTCQSWNDWLLVGEALLVGRVEAMRTANTNKPAGRRYNEEFSDWLKANKFDGIDKSTRSRLLECLAHRNEIEAWRAILTTSDRLKLNYPTAVLRRWQKTIVKKPDDAAPKLSPVAKLKESIIALEEQNSRMQREIERGGGDLWTAQDTAKDIARVIFEKTSPSKSREISRELSRLVRTAEAESASGPTTEVRT